MKRYTSIFTVVAVAASMVSCASRLEVTPPNAIIDEQINDILVNGNDSQKQAIVGALTNGMVACFNAQDDNNYNSTGSANTIAYSLPGIEWGRSLMGNDIVMGFDTDPYGLAGGSLYRFQLPFRSGNGNTNYCYWGMYAVNINKANTALGYLSEELAASQALYQVGRARALAARAYSYMCMMEEYQDAYLRGGKDKLGLSIYTEYNPLQPSVARSSSIDTWKFIIKDLTDARDYLTKAAAGYTAGRENSEDIDLGVVNFLLARASLLTGDWTACQNACLDIINSKVYSLIAAENYGGQNSGAWTPSSEINMSPVDNAFTNIAKNPETILGFKVGSSSYKQAAAFFNLAGAFTTYSQLKSTARIDSRLYDKINDKDVRKNAFREEEIGTYAFANNTTGTIPSYASMKFSATDGMTAAGAALGDPKQNTTCDYTKFRLSEVYLMLAEALCNDGKESAAKTYLDELLSARAVSGETLTTDDYASAGSMLDIVKLQWRIEMWGECGREYYNNKRWGVDVDRSNSLHVEPIKWSADKMTLHIPDRELQDNNASVDNDIID